MGNGSGQTGLTTAVVSLAGAVLLSGAASTPLSGQEFRIREGSVWAAPSHLTWEGAAREEADRIIVWFEEGQVLRLDDQLQVAYGARVGRSLAGSHVTLSDEGAVEVVSGAPLTIIRFEDGASPADTLFLGRNLTLVDALHSPAGWFCLFRDAETGGWGLLHYRDGPVLRRDFTGLDLAGDARLGLHGDRVSVTSVDRDWSVHLVASDGSVQRMGPPEGLFDSLTVGSIGNPDARWVSLGALDFEAGGLLQPVVDRSGTWQVLLIYGRDGVPRAWPVSRGVASRPFGSDPEERELYIKAERGGRVLMYRSVWSFRN